MNRYIFKDIFDYSWHKKKMEEQDQDKLPRCKFPECYHPIKTYIKKNYGGEDKLKKGDLCILHSCYHKECPYMVAKNHQVCLYHICSYTGCNNWLNNDLHHSYGTPEHGFCKLHICMEDKCNRPILEGYPFCYEHCPKVLAESEEQAKKKRKTYI